MNRSTRGSSLTPTTNARSTFSVVERDLVQMRERGVAGAEVVQGQRDAGLAELVGDLAGRLEVGQQAVLGDLDDQLVGRKVMSRNGIRELARAARGRRPGAAGC